MRGCEVTKNGSLVPRGFGGAGFFTRRLAYNRCAGVGTKSALWGVGR